MQRISEVLDINEFLVDIWASPPEDKSIPAAIESVALKEWVRRTCGPDANYAELQPVKKKAQGRKTASTPAGRKVSGKQKNVAVDVQADNQAVDGTRHANKDGVVNALPFLLVAISSPQRDVRTASLAGVTELANKADIWWPVKNEEEGIPCGDHMISRDCVVGLLKALSSQTHLIEGEGDVGEVLLRSTFEYAATRSKTVEASPKKGKSSQKKSGHAVSSSSDLLTSPLQLRIRDATAIMTWLVNRIPLMRSPAGLHAASYIIRLVHDCYPPQMLLISAQQLLKSLLCRDGAFPVNKSLAVWKVQTSLEYRLATELVGLYNDASLVPLFQDTKLRHEAEEGLSILLEAMSSPNKRDGPENLQAQAIKAATPALFNVLPQNEKARLLTVSTTLF